MNARGSSPTVTVFGSGGAKPGSPECEAAGRLGAELARRGFAVCNGGYGGTMAAAARGAREAGGATVGVTLGSSRAKPNEWLDEVLPQPDLTSRILCLFERGDAYAVLPGGTGTLAELGLLLEYQNKNLMDRRPLVMLGGFWGPLLDLLSGERILREAGPWQAAGDVRMIGHLAVADSPEGAAEYLADNL